MPVTTTLLCLVAVVFFSGVPLTGCTAIAVAFPADYRYVSILIPQVPQRGKY
jgi:hypothetical protein